MSLLTAGTIAANSLGALANQISVTSRNIANAGVAGASLKISKIAATESGVAFVGIRRATDVALFKNLISATASHASVSTVSDTLSRIDSTLNLSSSSNSRSSATLIAKLTSALQSYSASPQNETAAQLALSAAKDLASSLHDATDAVQNERVQADTGIAAAESDLNDLLGKFGALNKEIIAGTLSGADVTDALDQRDGLLTEISQRMGVSVVTRPNNDMVLYTDSGVTLFETTPRNVTFQTTPNLSPGVQGADVYVDGVRVTGSNAPLAVKSGSIQGMAEIRDKIAPQYQTQLDEIARGLVVAYSEKDQSGSGKPPLPGLFTYAGATQTPTAATTITGLAGKIEINANVDPSRGGNLTTLRDGGISGDPAYIYNPSHAQGYSQRLIELVEAPAARQIFDAAAGLGDSGTLSSIAAGSNGWMGTQRQQVDGSTNYFKAVVEQTTQALSNATGVNLDDQMSQMLALENSYQASAKLLESVNAMFDSLLAAVKA